MTDLLETVIEAHGGLERWTELDSVSARLVVQGGALWALKGHAGVLDDVFVRASLHEERESHHPFGAPDRRSAFTPQRVAIDTTAGEVIEELEQPRASFAGHVLETPWTALQLAYFVGTAMWTYLTQPFTFALPGFETIELAPWQEAGQEWRRLRMPARRPSLSSMGTTSVPARSRAMGTCRPLPPRQTWATTPALVTGERPARRSRLISAATSRLPRSAATNAPASSTSIRRLPGHAAPARVSAVPGRLLPRRLVRLPGLRRPASDRQ
ncbi:MAG TPA: hypothetical protein VIY52_08130 [Streptosporangiaceae bacterium]